MFCIFPLISFVYFYLVEGISVKAFVIAFWYPFDKFDYYIPIHLFESVSCHIFSTVPVAMDGFIMLMVGQFIVLFKCLGEKFIKIVNDFDPTKKSVTVEKMSKAIDSHNQLLELSAELFRIYEIPLLIHVTTQAMSICFLLFKVLVSVE
jgi:hypothetical protein